MWSRPGLASRAHRENVKVKIVSRPWRPADREEGRVPLQGKDDNGTCGNRNSLKLIRAATRVEIVRCASEKGRRAWSRCESARGKETAWPKGALITLLSQIASRGEISGPT